ncbi:DELLA protein 1-like [Vigna umbellata]|uniref:DELLA protein 1-like n=1 Tax=Vigna umbellata TaxID=87088 RepID=UPI001F5EEEBD|nr:DELLA protein 1-like [Vigna umbellata]
MGDASEVKGECSGSGKGKKMFEEEENEDKLLAGVGYKVCSSDMVDVAHKLDQLEMVMEEDGISHLASNTVHYDPTDLYGWVQNILNNAPNHTITTNSNNAVIPSPLITVPENDLTAIPLPYVEDYPQTENQNCHKRFKSSSSPLWPAISSDNILPVVLVEEAGVYLVHALMACAEAVQLGNASLASSLVKHAGTLAVSQGGSMGKVASFFAQALARRIYGFYPYETLDSSYSDMLHTHFYESSPYLKFAHFTANHAILEAFATADTVHVIDFGLKQGLQWPAFMQALAVRPGGPPAFRLSGIGPPRLDDPDSDTLSQVGLKLAELARKIRIQFQFRGFVCNSLADLDPSVLDIRAGEFVAVNSIFELHRLLARPVDIEKVLATVKRIKPEIVTVVEQEANHNGPVFLERFTEALYYYSSLFDSMEGSVAAPNEQALVMAEMYLGRQICNVVACEGDERVERHETLGQWRARLGLGGLEPVRMGSNAFRQARMLLGLYPEAGEGYRVEENNGCLLLGWHTRPLVASSAWRLAPNGLHPVRDQNEMNQDSRYC